MGRPTCLSLAVLVLSITAFARPSCALGDISIVVDDSGARLIDSGEQQGSPSECVGPLSSVPSRVSVANGTVASIDVLALVNLDPGLEIVPESCDVTAGTCTLMPGAPQVTWMVTVASAETENVSYGVRVGSAVPIHTTLCQEILVSINGGPPIEIENCVTTNSASQCGLGAPALGGLGKAALAALLALAGTVVLRRRRA